MLKDDPEVSSNIIANPIGLPKEELDAARLELETFAETTLWSLVQAERMAYYHRPSIEIFCRMDIGVMPDEEGNLQYFVNEVTRSPTAACLFSGHTFGVKTVAPNLGADFAVAFHKYLCEQHPDLHMWSTHQTYQRCLYTEQDLRTADPSHKPVTIDTQLEIYGFNIHLHDCGWSGCALFAFVQNPRLS